MTWVGWTSREGRGRVDRDEALVRVGSALEQEPPAFWGLAHESEVATPRSSGVARRRT